MHERKLSAMDGADPPRFTVGQIVLLQKLKQSGLSKDEIVRGLEEMEKLDEVGLGSPNASVSSTQNGTRGTSPSSSGTNLTSSGGAIHATSAKESEYQCNSTSPKSPRLQLNPAGLTHHMGQANPLMFSTRLQNPGQLSILPQVGQWPPSTSQAVAVATAAGLLQNGFAHGSVPHYPSLINNRGLMRTSLSSAPSSGSGSTIVEIDGEKVDITEEMEELFRRDQSLVKEDIRKFIGERHISQSSIAKATRNAISQSYISQWLAQPQDISGQKKKAMYTWYILEKRKPAGSANGSSLSHSIQYRMNDVDQDMMNSILKAKRGARFTWPKECLSILENYYNANSYPDESKREEIAHACNSIIQTQKPGGVLSDLDKVTTVKVYNWFANRRKDDKRRRHIEHVEAMDQQQQQHQQILSPRRSSTVSPSLSCNSNDSHLGSEHHNETPQPMVISKREDPMAIAIEMAAVNNSILALVNQHNTNDARDEDDVDDSSDSAFPRSGDEQEHRVRYGQLQPTKVERMAECGS